MVGVLESLNVSNLKPIRDMIYESIRQAIFEGELKSGDRLVEKDLAEKMKVSRTPIREALRKLEAEGLIKHVPRKGVVVKGFTTEEIVEIYSIRKALEALAITYTVKNITQVEIKKLQEILEEMTELTEKNDTKNLFDTFQKFNDVLLGSCKMPRLIKLISTYQEYLERFRMVSMAGIERKRAALKEHKEILQAVIEKDAKRAEELVKKHLQGALDAYLESLNKNKSSENVDESIDTV